MKTWTLTVLSFAVAFSARAENPRPSYETIANVTLLRNMVKKAGATGIECKFNYKERLKGIEKVGSVILKFEKSNVDDTGLVVASREWSYGTNEIWEVLMSESKPGKLVITYG